MSLVEKHLRWLMEESVRGNENASVTFASQNVGLRMTVSRDMIFASYPFSDDPEVKLQQLGIALSSGWSIDWDPEEFVILELGPGTRQDLRAFVSDYLRKVWSINDPESDLKVFVHPS